MTVAADVAGFELASYQKAVRALLRHPLVTSVYPDDRTLPLIRRWSDTLRTDLACPGERRHPILGGERRSALVPDNQRHELLVSMWKKVLAKVPIRPLL